MLLRNPEVYEMDIVSSWLVREERENEMNLLSFITCTNANLHRYCLTPQLGTRTNPRRKIKQNGTTKQTKTSSFSSMEWAVKIHLGPDSDCINKLPWLDIVSKHENIPMNGPFKNVWSMPFESSRREWKVFAYHLKVALTRNAGQWYTWVTWETLGNEKPGLITT